jgi:predicted nucleic acid-binding protein
VKVVADSSPLILLSKTGYFDLLKSLYPRIHISGEVYAEVVVMGAGLPGASKVAEADWIEVKQLQKPGDLTAAEAASGLGAGELSTILLGKEIQAELALIDDLRARQLARREGFEVRGSIGLLELLYRSKHIADLRAAFRSLLESNAYIDRVILDRRLISHGLRPL